MYKNLRTNLPKEVMAFPDFPFDDSECGKRSFIGHDEVRQYLERYTDHFDIRPCIQGGDSINHEVIFGTPLEVTFLDVVKINSHFTNYLVFF